MTTLDIRSFCEANNIAHENRDRDGGVTVLSPSQENMASFREALGGLSSVALRRDNSLRFLASAIQVSLYEVIKDLRDMGYNESSEVSEALSSATPEEVAHMMAQRFNRTDYNLIAEADEYLLELQAFILKTIETVCVSRPLRSTPKRRWHGTVIVSMGEADKTEEEIVSQVNKLVRMYERVSDLLEIFEERSCLSFVGDMVGDTSDTSTRVEDINGATHCASRLLKGRYDCESIGLLSFRKPLAVRIITKSLFQQNKEELKRVLSSDFGIDYLYYAALEKFFEKEASESSRQPVALLSSVLRGRGMRKIKYLMPSDTSPQAGGFLATPDEPTVFAMECARRIVDSLYNEPRTTPGISEEGFKARRLLFQTRFSLEPYQDLGRRNHFMRRASDDAGNRPITSGDVFRETAEYLGLRPPAPVEPDNTQENGESLASALVGASSFTSVPVLSLDCTRSSTRTGVRAPTFTEEAVEECLRLAGVSNPDRLGSEESTSRGAGSPLTSEAALAQSRQFYRWFANGCPSTLREGEGFSLMDSPAFLCFGGVAVGAIKESCLVMLLAAYDGTFNETKRAVVKAFRQDVFNNPKYSRALHYLKVLCTQCLADGVPPLENWVQVGDSTPQPSVNSGINSYVGDEDAPPLLSLPADAPLTNENIAKVYRAPCEAHTPTVFGHRWKIAQHLTNGGRGSLSAYSYPAHALGSVPSLTDRDKERYQNLRDYILGKPKQEFNHVPFLGVEFEMSYLEYDHIGEVLDQLPHGLGFLCSDGSVSDGGEIKTAPMEYEQAAALFERLLPELEDMGCLIDRSAGLHVHISKKSFRNRKQFDYLCTFLNAAGNWKFLDYVCGRSPTNYCRRREGIKLTQNPSSSAREKYSAIHEKATTYEFRLFAPTFDVGLLKSRLQFVLACRDFAAEVNDKPWMLTSAMFMDWLLYRTTEAQREQYADLVGVMVNYLSTLVGGTGALKTQANGLPRRGYLRIADSKTDDIEFFYLTPVREKILTENIRQIEKGGKGKKAVILSKGEQKNAKVKEAMEAGGTEGLLERVWEIFGPSGTPQDREFLLRMKFALEEERRLVGAHPFPVDIASSAATRCRGRAMRHFLCPSISNVNTTAHAVIERALTEAIARNVDPLPQKPEVLLNFDPLIKAEKRLKSSAEKLQPSVPKGTQALSADLLPLFLLDAEEFLEKIYEVHAQIYRATTVKLDIERLRRGSFSQDGVREQKEFAGLCQKGCEELLSSWGSPDGVQEADKKRYHLIRKLYRLFRGMVAELDVFLRSPRSLQPDVFKNLKPEQKKIIRLGKEPEADKKGSVPSVVRVWLTMPKADRIGTTLGRMTDVYKFMQH